MKNPLKWDNYTSSDYETFIKEEIEDVRVHNKQVSENILYCYIGSISALTGAVAVSDFPAYEEHFIPLTGGLIALTALAARSKEYMENWEPSVNEFEFRESEIDFKSPINNLETVGVSKLEEYRGRRDTIRPLILDGRETELYTFLSGSEAAEKYESVLEELEDFHDYKTIQYFSFTENSLFEKNRADVHIYAESEGEEYPLLGFTGFTERFEEDFLDQS